MAPHVQLHIMRTPAAAVSSQRPGGAAEPASTDSGSRPGGATVKGLPEACKLKKRRALKKVLLGVKVAGASHSQPDEGIQSQAARGRRGSVETLSSPYTGHAEFVQMGAVAAMDELELEDGLVDLALEDEKAAAEDQAAEGEGEAPPLRRTAVDSSEGNAGFLHGLSGGESDSDTSDTSDTSDDGSGSDGGSSAHGTSDEVSISIRVARLPR